MDRSTDSQERGDCGPGRDRRQYWWRYWRWSNPWPAELGSQDPFGGRNSCSEGNSFTQHLLISFSVRCCVDSEGRMCGFLWSFSRSLVEIWLYLYWSFCFGSTLNFMSGAHSWLPCYSVDSLAIRVPLLGRGEAPQCITQDFTPSKSWFLICKMGLIVTISWNFCEKIGFYEFCKHWNYYADVISNYQWFQVNNVAESQEMNYLPVHGWSL